jgi:hypothetical protein
MCSLRCQNKGCSYCISFINAFFAIALMEAPSVLFGVFTIARALMEYGNIERDLDVVELWSGTGEICNAATQKRFTALPYDLNRVPGLTDIPGKLTENICLRQGFENALKLVMRLKPGGLLWMSPECSSFVFANSSNCKRKRGFVTGDETYPKVVQGNLMADIAAFFFVLSMHRCMSAVMENPRNSRIWEYINERVPGFWLDAYTSRAHRCAYDDSAPPRIGPKEYVLKSVSPWILKICKQCSCEQMDGASDKHLKLIETNAAGQKNGNKLRMAQSAAYPIALAKEIVEVWADWNATAQHVVEQSQTERASAQQDMVGKQRAMSSNSQAWSESSSACEDKNDEECAWSD